MNNYLINEYHNVIIMNTVIDHALSAIKDRIYALLL